MIPWRRVFVRAVCCGVLLLSYGPLSGEEPRQTEFRPDGGTVGTAQLEGIGVVRWTAPGGVSRGETTVTLWFPSQWGKASLGFPSLVHLRTLDVIEDDTGKLLSTPERLKQINYLRGPVRGSQWQTGDGKDGPAISLLLDAPARKADKIRALAGTVEVAQAKEVRLVFNDLAAINGKELEHRDIRGLKDLKLRFSIYLKDGTVCAEMKSPIDYDGPSNLGRFQDWAMIDAGSEITGYDESRGPIREATVAENEGFTVKRTFVDRRDFKGWLLQITVLEPVQTKTFKLNFREIDLP